MAREVVPDLLPRIAKAAAAVRDADDAFRLAVRARDELIVEAVDEGITQRAVAERAKLSKGRIIAILANAPETHVV